MASLRTKLTIATAATTATVLVIFGLVIFLVVRSALRSEFDRVLDAKARGIAALVELDGTVLEVDFGNRLPGEFQEGISPDYFEIRVIGGPVLARSPSLHTAHLEHITLPNEMSAFRDVTLPDGRSGRAVTMAHSPRSEPVDPDDEESDADEEPSAFSWRLDLGEGISDGERRAVTIVVASAATVIDGTLAKLAWAVIAAIATGVLLTALAHTWVVRQQFAPLGRIASRIDQIDKANLTSRLPLHDTPVEMQPVVNKLNGLLARLDTAFEREQSFSADVAHELRTPLAGLLSTAEVALTKKRSNSEYQTCLQQTVKITKELRGVVESLLALARIEAGQVAARCEPLQLDLILAECWNAVSPIAEARGLYVAWDLQSERLVESDRRHLAVVLHNLLDNAVNHTDAGGSVWIASADDDRHVCLRITNTGSRVAATDAPRVFDRFWRGDAARQDTGRHSGLGLSIAKHFCDLLEISISAVSSSDGKFSVELRFRRVVREPDPDG